MDKKKQETNIDKKRIEYFSYGKPKPTTPKSQVLPPPPMKKQEESK